MDLGHLHPSFALQSCHSRVAGGVTGEQDPYRKSKSENSLHFEICFHYSGSTANFGPVTAWTTTIYERRR
jgi:hypothetical protein